MNSTVYRTRPFRNSASLNSLGALTALLFVFAGIPLQADEKARILDPTVVEPLTRGWEFGLETSPGRPPAKWTVIQLPYLWRAAPRGKPARVGWLRLRFILKSAPAEPLVMMPGIIVDQDMAYLNGQQIAQTGGPRPEDHAYDQLRRYTMPAQSLIVSPDGTRVNELLLRIVPLAGDRGGVRASRHVSAPAALIPRVLFLHNLPVLVFVILALAVSGYFLLFFLRRPQEKENLYFGLFCISLALLFVHSAEFKFWTGLPFLFLKRLEYATLFTIPFLGATFFFEIFELRKNRWINYYWYALAVGALLQIGVTVFSADYYDWKSIKRLINEPLSFSLLAVLLTITIVRMVRLDRTAWVLFGGLTVLAAGAILDMLSNQSVINLPPLMMYGFGGFVLSIAGLLSGRFVRLHKQVEDLNLNLEQKVEERTHQLSDALGRITDLKVKQDGDYFLTALLIDPLQGNRNRSETVITHTYVTQKKKFQFKDWDSQLGGDLCITDIIRLSGRTYVAFANGDAMGKSMQGAGGALVMGAMFNAALTRTQESDAGRAISPEKWLSDTYLELQALFESFNGSMFVSMMMGLVDEAGGQLYFVNAEHPDPVLLRQGRAQFLPTPPLRKIGMPDQAPHFSVGTVQLQPGDIVISGSDGRDDLVLEEGVDGRTINENEQLFLGHVEKSAGDLSKMAASIMATGQLIDDLSLLSLSNRPDDARTGSRLPDPVETASRLILEGKQLIQSGDQTSGLERFAQAVLVNPLDNRQIFRYAGALSKSGRLREALDQIERVFLRNPGDIDSLVALTDLYRRLGQVPAALTFLARAERAKPNDSRVARLRLKLRG